MKVPRATYRIQFTPQFKFDDATDLIPYLAKLGISHIYASPILKARKGSTHGYDVCDFSCLNPELGSMEEFEELIEELRKYDMGWIQDIVPNHMSFNSENPYLWDVLENGIASRYANFFDIDWTHHYDSLKGKLLAPFLGNFYGACLNKGELKLQYDAQGLKIAYYDNYFPIRPESYWSVFGSNLTEFREFCSGNQLAYMDFLGVLHTFKNLPGGDAAEERYSQASLAKNLLWKLHQKYDHIKRYIDDCLFQYIAQDNNGGADLFDNLHSEQNYRLAFWKIAAEEINYRRFFNISDLISIRMEDREVFNEYHSFIFSLIEKGMIDGLRVDHIDGLYNPTKYLSWLREKIGDRFLVVEKILAKNEFLPLEWKVEGTTGYDFLNFTNGLFCMQQNLHIFDKIYESFVNKYMELEFISKEKKRLIIEKHLAGDIENLAQWAREIGLADRMSRDITIYALKEALVELLISFPIYRTYFDEEKNSNQDIITMQHALEEAKLSLAGFEHEFEFLEKVLFSKYMSEQINQECRAFVMRLQQYTGPIMAKGIEDTALYNYNRLVSLNEVGGWPEKFGNSISEFHTFIQNRQTHWPHSMNATSTHDTKRGEHIRSRLNVLSEIPQEWGQTLYRWGSINKDLKKNIGGKMAPSKNDEYLFYQTILGTYPFRKSHDNQYIKRIQEYMIKAVKEAKFHTAWIKPDYLYEDAIRNFVANTLEISNNNAFLQDFLQFFPAVAWYGILNSLSQVVLKITSPGIPDFYQGCELWYLRLVDPDNRKPVNYEIRKNSLEKLLDVEDLVGDLSQSLGNGTIKQSIIVTLLNIIKQYPSLFSHGSYIPLEVSGTLANNLIAFLREYDNKKVISIVPRFFTQLAKPEMLPVGMDIWQDTKVHIPDKYCGQMTEVLSKKNIEGKTEILVGEILSQYSVGVLNNWEKENIFF